MKPGVVNEDLCKNKRPLVLKHPSQFYETCVVNERLYERPLKAKIEKKMFAKIICFLRFSIAITQPKY
jgi:hypothetical protein